MAISSYLRECGYDLGGLVPKVYLIHKNALKLSKKAKGLEVSVVSRNDGDIYCVEGQLCTYRQEETYNGKYRFNSTLELTINELYREPFLYGLRTLRTNEYYIIIEDKKGVQYLINPELYTKMSYEYSFSDTSGNNNHIIITYNNLSNYPLLIFEENISDNKSLLNKQCEYNYGQAYELLMFDHKDLKVKDDGVKVDEMYIENVDDICEIDFMKESFSLTESYDGKTFITSLAFNIPLNDQYGWAYRLLEFKDNKYAAILRTTNDNYIIVGVERGLFPSYTIETSEDDNVPNLVKVVFEQRSQYPILYTDEISQYRWVESEPLCFGFDRYQMLVKEKSEDWGETWVVVDPIVKKKGKIIETDSEACKEYQWVEDGEYCDIDNITYIKWENVDGFICEGGNKYHKTRRYVSEDGESFSPSDEYGRGELIEGDSKECQYVAVRWINDDGNYECYEVNEEYSKYGNESEGCSGTTKVLWEPELVSSNGIGYYESGEGRLKEVIKEDCCECGWTGLTWVFNNEYICGKDIDISGFTHLSVTDTHTPFQTVRIDATKTENKKSILVMNKPNAVGNYLYYINIYSGIVREYSSSVQITAQTHISGNTYEYTFPQTVYLTPNQSDIPLDQVEMYVENFGDKAKYEIWREANACDVSDLTENVEYRNPQYSYDCVNIALVTASNIQSICNIPYPTYTDPNTGRHIYLTNYMVSFYDELYLLGIDKFELPEGYTIDTKNLFYNCSSLQWFNFGDSVYEYEYTDTSKMFYYCTDLRKIDMSKWNLSKVTNMSHMFYYCSGLTSLDLSSFETSKVTNMRGMFQLCSRLKSLDLSNFDTSNVTNMSHMFSDCSGLTSLNVSNFDTSKVTNMSGMFSGCYSLTSLDLSNFDTSKVIDMSDMFRGSKGFTSLDLSNFDTSNVTDMSDMFRYCTALTSVDLSGWDTSKVIDMREMFYDCTALTSVDLSGWDTSNVTNMSYMFRNCTNLKTIYMRGCNQTTIDKINSVKPSNAQIITE